MIQNNMAYQSVSRDQRESMLCKMADTKDKVNKAALLERLNSLREREVREVFYSMQSVTF